MRIDVPIQGPEKECEKKKSKGIICSVLERAQKRCRDFHEKKKKNWKKVNDLQEKNLRAGNK